MYNRVILIGRTVSVPSRGLGGSNPLTVDIKIRTGIMFPYPHEDFFGGAN